MEKMCEIFWEKVSNRRADVRTGSSERALGQRYQFGNPLVTREGVVRAVRFLNEIAQGE